MLGCSEEVKQEDSIQKQDPMRMLRRWSLDITGKLPSVVDLQQVQENPELLEEKLDAMLENPLWNEMLVRQLNEQWHTRVDVFSVVPDDFAIGDYSIWYSFNRSVGEEPAERARRVPVEEAAARQDCADRRRAHACGLRISREGCISEASTHDASTLSPSAEPTRAPVPNSPRPCCRTGGMTHAA